MLLSLTSSFFPAQYMLYPHISFFPCFRLLLVSSVRSPSFSSLAAFYNIPVPSNLAFWILYLHRWYHHPPGWKLGTYPWFPSPVKRSLISRQIQIFTLPPFLHVSWYILILVVCMPGTELFEMKFFFVYFFLYKQHWAKMPGYVLISVSVACCWYDCLNKPRPIIAKVEHLTPRFYFCMFPFVNRRYACLRASMMPADFQI